MTAIPGPSVRVINDDGTWTREWYDYIRQLPVSYTGTWTPTIVTTSTAPTLTYDTTVTSGNYIKFNDAVHFDFRLRLTGVSSPTTEAVLIGLPFQAVSLTANHSRYAVFLNGILFQSTLYANVVGTINNGTTQSSLSAIANSTSVAVGNVTMDNFASTGCTISGSGMYRTSKKV